MSTEQLSINFTQIVEGPRIREKTKYGNIEGMVDSLSSLGTIHPIVLSKQKDNTFLLIAGGRRYRAMQVMKVEKLYHGSILNPERFGFLFEDEVPEHIRKQAELEENLYRLDMDWIDQVLAVADVHESKRAANLKWGLRQTAEVMGKGFGRSNVNYCVRIAKLLRANDKEILACKTMPEAISVLVKRKEDAALAELNRRVVPRPTAQLTAPGNISSVASFMDTFNLTGPQVAAPKPGAEPVVLPNVIPLSTTPQPPVEIPLSQMFKVGDSMVLMREWPDESFHHIVTDIPYGIDMKNLTNVADVADEHDVEQNLSMMPIFLEQAFRIIKPHGYCVFFYDLDHHEKLQNWARDVGWKVQRWPLHWVKTHNCKNDSPQFNFTKNVEHAMVLRRDEHSVLRSPQLTSVYTGDGAAERKLYNNPFAKPFALWKFIYDAIAFAGQSVYDPYCGEMSSCRAAVNCGLVPYGNDIKPQHINRGLEHMRGVYALLHNSNVIFS